MNKIWYFRLENVVGRYTEQLCNEWMPDAFNSLGLKWEYVGKELDCVIREGVVLDAGTRAIYSMEQAAEFIRFMKEHKVGSADIVFFQDFWNCGIEAIYYYAESIGLKLRYYAMLHAQSVDEYDFTYKMRRWMQPIEVGYSNLMAGIFVGSTIHREQLIAAGFSCPIHVVGLPINPDSIVKKYREEISVPKQKIVVYISRFDWEKNPHFMLAVAEAFLRSNPEWTWQITTGFPKLSSNCNAQFAIEDFATKNNRFIICSGISKAEYYNLLARATIQFNCSLQDYVSWTLLEAIVCGCKVVYPCFRSFPEILGTDTYKAFHLDSAVNLLNKYTHEPQQSYVDVLKRCNIGRYIEPIIMAFGSSFREVNVWQQFEFAKAVVDGFLYDRMKT